MTDKVVKRVPKKKAANTYKLPDPISAGEILTDMAKQQWILGTSIGVGGFGEIYSGICSFLTLVYFISTDFYIFYKKYSFYILNYIYCTLIENI